MRTVVGLQAMIRYVSLCTIPATVFLLAHFSILSGLRRFCSIRLAHLILAVRSFFVSSFSKDVT